MDDARGSQGTQWVTPSEAAYAAQCAVRTVRRWLAAGSVKAKRLPGGRWLVALDADGHPAPREAVAP